MCSSKAHPPPDLDPDAPAGCRHDYPCCQWTCRCRHRLRLWTSASLPGQASGPMQGAHFVVRQSPSSFDSRREHGRRTLVTSPIGRSPTEDLVARWINPSLGESIPCKQLQVCNRTCQPDVGLPAERGPRLPGTAGCDGHARPRRSPSEAPRELRLLLVSIRIPDPSPNRTGSRGSSAWAAH